MTLIAEGSFEPGAIADIDRRLSSPAQLSRAKSFKPQDINLGGFTPTTDNENNDKRVKFFEPCDIDCGLDPWSLAQLLLQNPS